MGCGGEWQDVQVCSHVSQHHGFFCFLFLFLSTPIPSLSSPACLLLVRLCPNCHVVIVVLERSSIFRNGGFIFIAQLVCQRSHNLATFPVVKN